MFDSPLADQLVAVVPADRSEPSSEQVAAGSHRHQDHVSAGPSVALDRCVPAGGVEELGGGTESGGIRSAVAVFLGFGPRRAASRHAVGVAC